GGRGGGAGRGEIVDGGAGAEGKSFAPLHRCGARGAFFPGAVAPCGRQAFRRDRRDLARSRPPRSALARPGAVGKTIATSTAVMPALVAGISPANCMPPPVEYSSTPSRPL